MPQKIKVEAKEVSLAIEKGLKQLGLRRDQVEVKILENPRKGFLGIGARPAVVELRQKRWISGNLDAQIYMDVPKKKRSPGRGKTGNRRSRKQDGVQEIKRGGRRAYGTPRRSAEKTPRTNETQLLPSADVQNAVIPDFLKSPMEEAKTYLANILAHMDVKVENLHTWWDEKQHRILLTFDCDHPAIVIGKEGKTLEALQYLTTLSISRHFDKPISVIADTQNYWRKTEDKINADLEYGINQIKKGYSVYRFRPMSAQLRRYIHRAVENNEFVITVSEGESEWRKVTLRPRPADQPVQKKATETAAAPAQIPAETAAAPAASAAEDAGATCQAEMARNCAEGETQVGCGCSDTFQPVETAAEAAAPAMPTKTAPVAAAAEAPAVQVEAVAAETAPVTQETPAAAATAEMPKAATVQPAVQDCGPLFGAVEQPENK